MSNPFYTLKLQAHQFCKKSADARIKRIKKVIEEIESTLFSETKSSAGDKHETGRAMVQLEREKLGQQLAEAEKTREQLQRIQPDKTSQLATSGSLVMTNTTKYYLAISAGKFENEQEVVYCISANTPIGKQLLGKKKGDTFRFNGLEQTILEIQ